MSKKILKTVRGSDSTTNPFTHKVRSTNSVYAPKIDKGTPLTTTITFNDGSKRKWKDHEKKRVEMIVAKLIVTL